MMNLVCHKSIDLNFYYYKFLNFKFKKMMQINKSLCPEMEKGIEGLNILLIIAVQSTNLAVLNNSPLSVFQQNFVPIPDDMTKRQAAAY